MEDSTGSMGIVFKNRVGLYEKELKLATSEYASAMMSLDTAELDFSTAKRDLSIETMNVVNAGLAGSNQQQRDAQLAALTTKQRNAVEDADRLLTIARHKLDIVNTVLIQARMGMSFITAAMNSGYIISCLPDKDLDKEAEEFAAKF